MTDIIVSSGQIAPGVSLGAGDTMEVLSGGTALQTKILSGGELTLSGGTARGAMVKSGGFEIVSSGGRAHHTIIGSGGEVVVSSGGLVTAPVISGGLLSLDHGYRLGGSIDFAGAGGELMIDVARTPGSANAISGLVPGDIIDLAQATFVSGGSATLITGNELEISEGGNSYTIYFDPKQDFSGFVFTLAIDRFGHTEVIEHTAEPVDIRVAAGESASGTFLFFGDTMEVFAGGSAVRTVLDGGVETLSGGTARGTAVGSGGEIVVSSGGRAVDAAVSVGGEIVVSSGGVALGTMLNSGGEIVVSSGGVTRGTNLGENAVEILSAGGLAVGTVLDIGEEIVASGGVARDTMVGGGTLEVASGGIARDTMVDFGGEIVVSAGGTAVGTVVSSVIVDGFLFVGSGAAAFRTIIGEWGEVTVGDGGSAHDTVVNSGGFLAVAGVARGTVLDDGGSATVFGGGRIVAPVISGGTLVLGRHYRLGGGVDFAGSGGSLVISGNRVPNVAHAISGFAPGDTIDLATVGFTSGGSATLSAGNELEISEGGKTFTLHFDPQQDFSGDVFTWADDGNCGTLVSEKTAPATTAGETSWFGAAPEVPSASPRPADAGTLPGHPPPASLAHVSGGLLGRG